MESRTITSTSLRSATTDDIVLREAATIRLLFRPLLVQNDEDAAAGVKGTFIYQRKNKSQAWEDLPPESLRTIKSGEEYRLELHSQELLKLYTELTGLYDIHKSAGVPRGQAKFVRAEGTVAALSRMSDQEIRAVIGGTESLGAAAVARLIKWASTASNFTLLFDRLQTMEPDSLRNLNVALGVSELKRAQKTWSENRDNADEEFWQDLLQQQVFVLEQLFSFPVVVIKGKAYVGGKTLNNKGGHVADFLVKNAVTNAIGIIEIKTPKTRLLGSEYRDGIFNVSTELSGAVQQVIAYRHSLMSERDHLLRNEPPLTSFTPRCIVLIGHAKNELTDNEKRQAFDLFRYQMKDVEIITYDEMVEKNKRLVKLLEGESRSN